MEKKSTRQHFNFEDFDFQLKRLVADAESEKEVRRDRNKEIDRRLLELEKDKIKRDTTVKIIIIVLSVVWTLIGAAIGLIINHFFK